MSQLSLNISTRLSYSPENFLMHSGVQDVFHACAGFLSAEPVNFAAAYIQAPRKYGKTHFSIAIADELVKRGRYPRLVEGSADLCLSELLQDRSAPSGEVLIVDDIDLYLHTVKPGFSGAFVELYEAARVRNIGLLFLGASSVSELPCDDHVMSRLRGRDGFRIGEPVETDLPALLDIMARQRGLVLQERHLTFLEKRLPRTIPALEDYLSRLDYLSQVTGRPIRFPILGDAI